MSYEMWLAAAGIIIGLVGIVVAVLETRKYRGPQLCYQYHGSNLIESYDAVFPETIEVSFGGGKVPNLTHSQVVIWNRGSAPIRGNEVTQSDPLILKINGGGEILQAEVVRTSKESNLFRIDYRPRSEEVGLSFDFLDSKDGALLSIWHTGVEIEPIIVGTLIHGRAGPFRLGRFVGPQPNLAESKKAAGTFEKQITRLFRYAAMRPQIMAFFSIFAGVSLTLAATIGFLRENFEDILPYFLHKDETEEPSLTFQGTLILAGVFYAAMGFFMWTQIRRRFPKNLLPREYSKDI